MLNEAWGKNRDKKLWVGLFLFSFLSVVGQKLNLSWVGLRVARFSVNRKAVKWSVVLNFLRHCQGSTVVFYHWR